MVERVKHVWGMSRTLPNGLVVKQCLNCKAYRYFGYFISFDVDKLSPQQVREKTGITATFCKDDLL